MSTVTTKPHVSATRVPPLSQSKFELMACPHLYVSRVVLGIDEPQNEYALRGSQVHEGAAHYVDHLIHTRQTSDVEWFEQNILSRPYLPDALQLLERMAGSLTVDPERVLDTELWLPLDENFEALDCDPGDPAVAYEGTLDYVGLPLRTSALIEDYKTYWQVCDVDSFQSDLYPLLLMKHFTQLEEVVFRLNFVRYGVKREKTLMRDDIPRLEKQVQEARRRQMELHRPESAFAAAPGSHCAYCPKLTKGCPIAEINPYTNQPVEERVKFGIWLQQAKKENDRILKDLVKFNGPVKVADANGTPYVATFGLTTKGSYPAIPCLSLVSANDPELAQKLKISGLSTPLKAKKRAGLAGLLAEYKLEEQQTRFSIKGAEEETEDGE